MSSSSRLLIVGALLIAGGLWARAESAKQLAEEFRPQQGSPSDSSPTLQQSASEDEDDPDGERPQVGHRAPEISAVTIDGSEVHRKLGNYPRQVVVLYVWTTWCGYCRREMPEMEALHREFRGQGVFVLAVAANGDDDLLRETVRERGLSFDVLRDVAKATEKAYAVRGYPLTVIIDRNGVIRATRYGYAEDGQAKNLALIRQLLAE